MRRHADSADERDGERRSERIGLGNGDEFAVGRELHGRGRDDVRGQVHGQAIGDVDGDRRERLDVPGLERRVFGHRDLHHDRPQTRSSSVAIFDSPPATITVYYHQDLIGSVRAVTDAAGICRRRRDMTISRSGRSSGSRSRRGRRCRRRRNGLGERKSMRRRFCNTLALGIWPVLRGSSEGLIRCSRPQPELRRRRGIGTRYALNGPLRFVDRDGLEPTSTDERPLLAEQGIVTSESDGPAGFLDDYIKLFCKSLLGGPNDPTPVYVGFEWLTGLGDRRRTFVDGQRFTESLREHPFIQGIADGIANGTRPLAGHDVYNLGGFGGVLKYIRDYSTLATFGLTGNLAVTYLGSFRVSWATTDGVINFRVTNSSSLGSALRPPVLGYEPWWIRNVAEPLGRGSGPMSTTFQSFVFNEPLAGHVRR